ncbi:helix-turn-helix domain-containing protein [Companilactobacillus nodensis]|uniref:XRE family transcriptional regulator n=1 Tax=Companilactobacillus nodensis DSM 19682 = JCM 14932 = NBRC 107160 TaxID=1423775 RepID=A0A0R1KDW9_9LACO|nr:helix-turn-helix transcriptional regulator [Companilactobacillus nodensis]KRK78593.1 XRE family transcriptional regulator [Companilactobacillus nodensis DSM 19682 = JCM 14932 = NBRC 107160]
MELNMGMIISQKRKEKQITQQQLAEFMGVSKASVSKWETGQSYPDITLIPLLAGYFNISIDQLMNYSNNLSTEQIRHIYTSITHQFETDPPEEVWKSIEDVIHRYYSCAPLVLEMGQLLLNHGDLLPGDSREEKMQTYLGEAQKLFSHVLEISNDRVLLDKATDYSAYCALMLKKPDEVLNMLGEYVPEYYPTESLIAWAYQLKCDKGKAIATTQSSLFQYTAVMMSQINNYLQLVTDQPDKFKQTYDIGQSLIESFSLKQLNPAVVINFYNSSAIRFAQQHLADSVMKCLSEYINVLRSITFPLRLHGNDYFDRIDSWLDQTDLGHALPRDENQMKADFITIVTENPFLQQYQDNEEFKEILKRLNTIEERFKNA